MAVLRHMASGREYRLTSEFTIGRSPRSELVLTNIRASNQHAVLQWTGICWAVCDLGSKNYTFLSGEPLPSRILESLQVGARLGFGDRDDLFELIDESPPEAIAVSDGGLERVGADGLLALPDSEQPRVTIFVTESGHWLGEWSDGPTVPLIPGQPLDIDGVRWTVDVPMVLEPTVGPERRREDDQELSIERLQARFLVSMDEESVALQLRQGTRTLDLPARSHNYLLLTLARARLAEQGDAAIPESECGWLYLPDLMDDLRVSETHFNVTIYRARKQWAKAGVKAATGLIERRTSARLIRIGVRDIEIGR